MRARFRRTTRANLVKDYLSFKLRAAPGDAGVSALRRRFADPLLILQLTTALVLFIACTNLANLVLARASAREREFAVRLAVGGSLVRLVRQLMVENALIAFGGAVAGLACAMVISRALIGLLGTGLSLDLPLDLRLMAFMLGVASLACLTFGLIPAWRASRVSAVDAMRATVRSPSGSREGTGLRRALVIAQVACSLVLLFGGLLFTGTLRNLLAVDAGFDSRNVAVARVNFSSLAIPQANRPVVYGQRGGEDSPDSRRDRGGRGTARSAGRHGQHHVRLARGGRRNVEEHAQDQRGECRAT